MMSNWAHTAENAKTSGNKGSLMQKYFCGNFVSWMLIPPFVYTRNGCCGKRFLSQGRNQENIPDSCLIVLYFCSKFFRRLIN